MPGEIYKAIRKFWADALGLKVYEQGFVPTDARLPYATFTIDVRNLFKSSECTVYTWHEKNRNIERMSYADKLFQAISDGGERIDLKGGREIVLYRGLGFTSHQDEGAIANRFSYQINYYI